MSLTLADQIEAHASNYVHAAATERLLRQAAAAIRALMAERDEARALSSHLHQRRGELVIERDNARRAAFARAKALCEEQAALDDFSAAYRCGCRDCASAIAAEMEGEKP